MNADEEGVFRLTSVFYLRLSADNKAFDLRRAF